MDLMHVLRQLPKVTNDRVLVGIDTADDAGVYRLDDERALIQTVDFFTPILDDPYQYGQVAAANSLSDVYAMGGVPLTVMNVVCFPMDEHPKEWLVEILRGSGEKVRESGAVVVGGHTVNDETIMFGLSVTGLVHPDRITANQGALPGDDLVLTKGLGTGIVTTALKAGIASEEAIAETTESMMTLNAAAARAMVKVGVHACTDVTGFGLMGHLFEMLENSGVSAEVDTSALPLLNRALDYAREGINTGGGTKNAEYLGERVRVQGAVEEALRIICFDPQTSGGLLIAVPPDRTPRLLEELEAEGANVRAKIGQVTADPSASIYLRAG